MKTLGLSSCILLALVASSYGLPRHVDHWHPLLPRLSNKEGGNRAAGNVQFYLYTQANPNTPQELVPGDEDSIRRSHFDKSRHTKIIIHGWGGAYTTTPNPQLRAAYFKQGDNFNIISVDWNTYSKLNYFSSRAKVPIVGEDVAELIDFLNEKFGMSFRKLVVIGHSLGAHVAGYTGKRVTRGRLEAIVGLDPAFPFYSYENSETRLDSGDAEYVMSIQTNGNVKGFLKPIGDAAFYPNWGRLQPGCGTDLDGSCSHGRCVTLYAEALGRYSYSPVYRCPDFANISDKAGCDEKVFGVEIGDPLQVRQTKGIFYFETDDSAPYGHLIERREG